MSRSLVLVAAALALAGDAALAQSPQPRQGPPPGGYTRAIAINPFGIPLGFVNAEYEAVVGSGVTLGVNGSYSEDVFDDDDDYAAAELKARYYPAERGLRGFAVGLGVGYARVEQQTSERFFPGGVQRTSRVTDGPALSVSVDYNWLLGRRQRFLVGLGLGAKRIFADDPRDDEFFDDPRALPTGRFVIGFAF